MRIQSTLYMVVVTVFALLLGTPATAQGVCPPPPNPNSLACPLDVDRSVLQEADIDGDGQPDNFGSTGTFCGGDSAADCVGYLVADIGFELLIEDPARQTVTCFSEAGGTFLEGVDIWIMNSTCGSCLSTGFGTATLPAGSTQSSSIRVVVADVNGDVCPCGPLIRCTVDIEAACSDGADGDGDGLIDAADPDCYFDNDGDGFGSAEDCNDANANVHAIPLPLETVSFHALMGESTMQWPTRTGDHYDVISGFLNDLRTTGNYNDSICLQNDDQSGQFVDPRTDPGSGDGYYYLVRTQNSCGDGGYLESPLDPEPRQTLVDLATCPYDPDCPTCVFTDCDLVDPDPICIGDQCLYNELDGTTYCDGPPGIGTDGSSCSTSLSCQPGHICVDGDFGFSFCSEWCTSDSDCSGLFGGPGNCSFSEVNVDVDGVAHGVCD